MGRARGKGKKQAVIAVNDDPGHGEEKKLHTSKRRGRPQKPLKGEVLDKEESEKTEDDENTKSLTTSKDSTEAATDSRRKRKRATLVKESPDPVKKAENGTKHSSDSSGNFVKSMGFRPNGSRRKSKPCRAAEVGVIMSSHPFFVVAR